MIKGIRKVHLGIQDKKVREFLNLLNIEYDYVQGHPLGEIQFVYKYRHFEFDSDVKFEEFINEFLEKFYIKGYTEAVDRLYHKTIDAICRVEEKSFDSYHELVNNLKSTRYE
jgi:hypothetical protein